MDDTLHPLSWLSGLVWGKPEEGSPAEEATIYLYRVGEKKAFFRRFKIWINGKYIGKLDNWGSMALKLEPGTVRIETALSGLTIVPRLREEVTLDVHPGCEYFIEGNHRSGMLRGSLGLSEVTEPTFRKYASSLKNVGWRKV